MLPALPQPLQDAVRRIGLAWTPVYTVVAIVVLAVAIGFLPFFNPQSTEEIRVAAC